MFFNNIDLPALSELAKLDHLTSIRFKSMPLTDEGLSRLANLTSLKPVTLFATQVTPASLAKFQAARPDVAVDSDLVGE